MSEEITINGRKAYIHDGIVSLSTPALIAAQETGYTPEDQAGYDPRWD